MSGICSDTYLQYSDSLDLQMQHYIVLLLPSLPTSAMCVCVHVLFFFFEKGIFYPASTSNRIYAARSNGDLNSGPWIATQVTATARLHAFSLK